MEMLLKREADRRETRRKADQLKWRREEERFLKASGHSASTFEVTVTRTSESVGILLDPACTTKGGHVWAARVNQFKPPSKTMRRGELEESGCVKPGDVLFEINGMATDSQARASALIADVPEGAALRLKFWRRTSERTSERTNGRREGQYVATWP